MRITAAVVESRGAPFRLAEVDLAEPAADELIVRMVASGICQTDLHGRDAYYGTPFPCVFGHEGAGVVERVGTGVTRVKPGTRVIMFSPACGACGPCDAGLPGYCDHARRIKMSGLLRSGRPPMSRDGAPLYGAFFQQSSFATHALATERNVIAVPDGLPLEVMAAFPCGVNTGAGAVQNVLAPHAGQSFVLFGAGTVGLSGMMMARHAGCTPIIVVEPIAERRALALALGASHALDPAAADIVEAIRACTGGRGADRILEAVGLPAALRAALDALAPLGICCLAGSARPGTEVALEMTRLQGGRTVRGCIQGDAPPDTFFPTLFGHYRTGVLAIDRLVTVYPFEDIERAAADMASGRTIKAVLRIGIA